MTSAPRATKGSPVCVAAALVLVAAFITLPAGAQQPPAILQVPLLPFAGTEQWVSPLIDRILSDKLGAFEGLRLINGEERALALQELSKNREIGPEELSAATAVAGADYAVVGQFMYDEESFNLDLRIFSAEESKQAASFQKPVPASGIFDALAEAALFVAETIGLEPGDEVSAALRRNPTTSLQAYRLYLRSQSEREPEKHMELLKQALDLDPDYLDATIDLGLGYYRMGKGEDALPYMQRAAALGSDMPEVHNNLAVLYADLGMKEEALKEFNEAIDLKPDYPEARLNYGRLLEESGRLDQAEGIYLGLLERDPDNLKARSSLALLYERTGRTELAVQEFRILSRRNPELAENYFVERGQSARKAKEYGNAEKFFLRAVDINPQLSQGYAELGTNSYLAGEYEKSMEYFRKALALEPQRAEYHYYLGLALEKSGDQMEAKASFQRSAELGGPLENRLSLARVYLAAGEITHAIDELNLVLDEDPSAEEAKELLARTMRRAETDQQRAEQRAEFATHRLGRLESIIEDLTRTNRDLENRVLSLQTERQNIELELEQLRGSRAAREKEYGRRMEDAIRSIEQLTDNEKIEKLREEYAIQVRRLEEQLVEARRTAGESGGSQVPDEGDLSHELSEERRKSSELEEKVRLLEEELDEAAAGAKGLGLALETLRSEGAAERGEVEALRKKLEDLQQEKEKSAAELSRMEERSSAFAGKIKGLEGELEEARQRVKELSAESRDLPGLRGKLAELQAERDAMKRELAGLEEQAANLAGEKRRMEERLATFRTETDEAKSAMDQLQTRLVAVELESYQRIEEARAQAAIEVSAMERDLQSSRERERQALLEMERLERSVAETEDILAAGEEQVRQALRAEEQVREALNRTRMDLAQQSLELGRMHMRNRSWDKARAAFEKVLDIDSRNGEAYYSLGEIFFQLGEFDRSKEMYKRAKDIF